LAHGERIQYNGMGYQPRESNGVNGDLIVTFIHQYDQNKFRIQGNIVYELVEIPYYDCILGTTFEHMLPNNKKVNVKVNECSSEGTQIRLKGIGINGNDYIIIVKVKMPTRISDKERNLLEQIRL
jgi:molecular chaperone DnaJ